MFQLFVSVGVNVTVITASPTATGVTVTCVYVLAFTSAALVAGDTVAFDVALLAFVNLPAVVAFSLNVKLYPTIVVPSSSLNVITGVAFSISHVNVFCVVPSLNAWFAFAFTVTT